MDCIELKNITKIYSENAVALPALIEINLVIKQGEMVAIMGPSGSGKSTLMNIIGLLDRPTSGEVKLNEKTVDLSMSDNQLAHVRGKTIGFIFQSFNLLPRLSALSNVLVPTTYQKIKLKQARNKATEILDQVGLINRIRHKPTQLSGGEKQRVAIARALINNPSIILADEPTGNLDSVTGQEIMDILKKLHREGKTIIIITHDDYIAKQCQRTIRLLDGRIVGD